MGDLVGRHPVSLAVTLLDTLTGRAFPMYTATLGTVAPNLLQYNYAHFWHALIYGPPTTPCFF